jgi:hypothetical protein
MHRFVIKKPSLMLWMLSLIITSCGPGQFLGPTLTPTLTSTSSPSPTATPTITPTATYTPTPTQTRTTTPTRKPTSTKTITPTPLPGLGVKASEIEDTFTEFFTFRDIPDVEGNPARKGTTTEGYSTITLVGDPYLMKAELNIDFAKEASFAGTAFWILFLEETTHGGEAAAKWVLDNFKEAIVHHKAEKVFGRTKVTLESNITGSLFLLTITPAGSQ